MKRGFTHFDSSHRENFCAAVLLLTMEVDDAVKELVARLVREQLSLSTSCELSTFGREARLEQDEDGTYSRVDLWLRYESDEEPPQLAFGEVKTHSRWHPANVARQVREQAKGRLASNQVPICGAVLLAPERLRALVQKEDEQIRTMVWSQLIRELRALPVPSKLAIHAIEHLEEQMERPPGLNRPITLDDFETATKLVACLRGFLVDCITHKDVGGSVHGEPLFTTPADGRPRRSGGWSWHGLAVPFTRNGTKGRVGIYKYSEAPLGETDSLETLWLEAYLGEGEMPVASVKFAPVSLSTEQLDAVRAEFTRAWPR